MKRTVLPMLLVLPTMAAPASANDGPFFARSEIRGRLRNYPPVVQAKAEARLCPAEIGALIEHQRMALNYATPATFRPPYYPAPAPAPARPPTLAPAPLAVPTPEPEPPSPSTPATDPPSARPSPFRP